MFFGPVGKGAVDLSNPQSWNAYAYALNNPTTLTDPEGTDVHVCTFNENGGQTCNWYSDEEYNQAAAAQNAQNNGVTTPVGTAQNGGHPNGDIMCGGSICGTVQWGDAPAVPATIGPVEIGLAFAGGVSLLRGAVEDIGEGAVGWVGRTLGVGGEEEGAGAAAGEETAARTPVGTRGSPLWVAPGTNADRAIDGISYSGHALDEMQSEGITPSVVKDAIENGSKVPSYGDRMAHFGDGVKVVTDRTRKVITVMLQSR